LLCAVALIYMIKSTFRPLIVLLALTQIALAQGKYTLFGDVKIDDSKVQGQVLLNINLILYTEAGAVVGRQLIMAGGRYPVRRHPHGRLRPGSTD
jgi:hypothetical protein